MQKNNHQEESNPWIVMKFGGSSVANPAHWPTIVKIVQNRINEGFKPFLVLSALKNVSNQLETLLNLAINNQHAQQIRELQRLHGAFADSLNVHNYVFSDEFIALNRYCEQIHQAQCFQGIEHAKIVSRGEILSTRIAHDFMNQHLPCHWMDAREIIRPGASCSQIETSDLWHHYVSAKFKVDFDKDIEQRLRKIGGVIITQGFIASDREGKTILLGREGSDTSASYIATLIGARKVEIWTDVSGIYTTDPSDNPSAKQFLHLGYDVVRRMANFGAKVLHPEALIPLTEYGIPLKVKGIKTPLNPGTYIGKHNGGHSEPEILSVVKESGVCQIKMSAETVFEPSDSKLLMDAGYDRVFETSQSNQRQYIFKFVDSARAPVDLHALLDKNKDSDSDIQTGLELVTIIGKPLQNKDDFARSWLERVKEFINNVPSLQPLESYVFADVGRLSLLVPQTEGINWCRELHQEFIEKEFNVQSQCYFQESLTAYSADFSLLE